MNHITDIQQKFHLEYITPDEDCRKDCIAIFIGGSGFSAEKSFGNEIKLELEQNNIRVIFIPGPATIIHGKLHGYYDSGKLSLLKFPKAFCSGKGGINENVDTAMSVLIELISKKYLNPNATLLLEGWSRGAIIAQRLTHQLTRHAKTKLLVINLRLDEPVIGGKPTAYFKDPINTIIADNVIKYRIAYATNAQPPHFAPILIYAVHEKSIQAKSDHFIDLDSIKHEIKTYLPTIHIGMNWPNLNSETDVYHLTVLLRKLDWDLYLNADDKIKLINLYTKLCGKELEQSLKTINERLSRLRDDIEIKNKTASIQSRLMNELITGRLLLYREAALDCHTCPDENKKIFLDNIEFIENNLVGIKYKLISSAAIKNYFRTVRSFLSRVIKKRRGR